MTAAAAAITLATPALPGGPAASAMVLPPTAGASAPVAMRTVNYHGYQISVPASWPVYNLSANPARCVLFNQHAVYLGTPGANQRCPSRAYGRTEAVLVQPAVPSSKLPPSTIVLPGNTAALQTGALPHAVSGVDSAAHTVQVSVPGPGVLVTATYGSDQALVRTILAGARMTSTAASGAPAAGAPAGTPVAASAPAAHQATSGRSVQKQSAAPVELTGRTTRALGFDACTAPSVATMTDWLSSPYRVAGTYLGGANWACTYGNFNTSWISQVTAEGWQFIPIWVGPQAPCTTIRGVTTVDPSQATSQGQAEAATAVATAQGFGYGTGSPIYFDMEGYNNADTSCSQAVLAFIAGWTQGLHAAGYTSGVYSSAGSGMVDLASQYSNPDFTRPDDIWIAHWNSDPVLTDSFVPNTDWPGPTRLHQYQGSHNETWGGATVNIDNDAIHGAVAGLPGSGTASRPFLNGQPSAVTAAPGTTTAGAIVIHGKPHANAEVHWSAAVPAGVTVTPGSGVAKVPPGGTITVPLTIGLSASLAPGRYEVPVTATAGKQQLTETFVMVSAAPAGTALPTSSPIVLYAADRASMADAATAAQSLALPVTDVTGNFSAAWTDATSGSAVVLSVGKAATNALFTNPCGWANPAGETAGHTPFFFLGVPLRKPAGRDVFEPSGGKNSVATALLTGQLLQYDLAGVLPDEGSNPDGPVQPTGKCLGAPNVPVP